MSLLAMAATNTQRVRRDRDAYMTPSPPPPPAPPHQPPTITPSWRIPLSLAWAIVVFAVTIGGGLLWQAWEIRQSVRDLRYGVWTIEDQRELTRMAAQGGVILPDAVEVVRRRLPGPIYQP